MYKCLRNNLSIYVVQPLTLEIWENSSLWGIIIHLNRILIRTHKNRLFCIKCYNFKKKNFDTSKTLGHPYGAAWFKVVVYETRQINFLYT